MIRTLPLLAAILFAAEALAQGQGDPQAGQRKAQVCQACHGPDGNGIGDGQYPLLAGQYADYLEKALRDYKSGVRANPVMAGFAAPLSEQDIADLAAFYAGQSGSLRVLGRSR